MSLSFPLFFQPTFTQGLIIGQLSILFFLGAILKYLFFESGQADLPQDTLYHQQVDTDAFLLRHNLHAQRVTAKNDIPDSETAEWLNALLKQVVDVYRSKIRGGVEGIEGDEVARTRVENYVNFIRPSSFLDKVVVHSVDLGVSAPALCNARIRKSIQDPLLTEVDFDVTYTDTLSISLSTSYLFNYPMASFARLPISLTISLSLFKSSITVQTPIQSSSLPVITFTISPTFVLDLTTTSLMGSRAKLANVPKLHDLIQHQARRILTARSTWSVSFPWLAKLSEVQKELEQLEVQLSS